METIDGKENSCKIHRKQAELRTVLPSALIPTPFSLLTILSLFTLLSVLFPGSIPHAL